jgi:hypothetical protein
MEDCKMNEELDRIYSGIRSLIAGQNGNNVCEVLSRVLSDVIILYCDRYEDDSDVDRMVDSIALHIKKTVKSERKQKGV